MKFLKRLGFKVKKLLDAWDEKDTTEKVVTATITTAMLATSGFLIVKFHEEIFAIVALGIVAVVLAFSNGYGQPPNVSEQTLGINSEYLHEAVFKGLENLHLLQVKLGNDLPPYQLDFSDTDYMVITYALYSHSAVVSSIAKTALKQHNIITPQTNSSTIFFIKVPPLYNYVSYYLT